MAALAAIGCAVALAGCGSSSHSTHGSGRADFLAFSKCMRANGVSDFPDPSPGGGIQLNVSSGLNPFSPAFKSARASCRKLLPGGGPPSTPSPQRRAQLFAVARCMRAHGISGFPDPTSTPPSNPAAFGVVEDADGVVLAIPKTVDIQAPSFKSAASACGFNG